VAGICFRSWRKRIHLIWWVLCPKNMSSSTKSQLNHRTT
jgi:hypothetical protein